MKKRGISQVVTTVLIILISIIAVIIAWQFIRNSIKQSADKLEIPIFTDLEISEANIVDGLNLRVQVSLGNQQAIEGVLISATNGIESQSFKYNQTINKLESRTFTIPLNISGINKVSIAPIYIRDNKEVITEVSDTLTSFKPKYENLVAYYKFEGNAKDETGKHNGIGFNIGYSNGLNGQALLLNENASDYVRINDSDEWDLTTFSISAWFKASGFNHNYPAIVCKDKNITNRNYIVLVAHTLGDKIIASSSINAVQSDPSSQVTALVDTWYNVIYIINDTSKKRYIYVDGEKKYEGGFTGTVDITTADVYIGRYFDGLIDEVKIFDRALSPEEIDYLNR